MLLNIQLFCINAYKLVNLQQTINLLKHETKKIKKNDR